MNQSKSLVKLFVGMIFFGISLFVFNGSGLFVVDNGMLGATNLEIAKRVFEVLLSVMTALLGTGLFSKLPWMKTLIDVLTPFLSKDRSPEATKEKDLMRMLQYAIFSKNVNLTIMLCEEAAGERYISGPEQEPEAATTPKPKGFPLK